MNEDFKSEWNYAQAYMQQIDRCERRCEAMAFNEEYEGWLRAVEGLYRVLYRVMTDKEVEEARVLIKKAASRVKMYSRGKGEYLGGVRDADDVREKLTEAETYLRSIVHAKGMALPQKADPGEALLE